MDLNFKEIFTAVMVLFAVIDIVGNIPIIIDLRSKVGHIHSERASIVAGLIMIAFLFLGKSILNLIGIDVNSFAVAGSFILFFLALEMILGISLYKEEHTNPKSISVFPIAFPLIAGLERGYPDGRDRPAPSVVQSALIFYPNRQKSRNKS